MRKIQNNPKLHKCDKKVFEIATDKMKNNNQLKISVNSNTEGK